MLDTGGLKAVMPLARGPLCDPFAADKTLTLELAAFDGAAKEVEGMFKCGRLVLAIGADTFVEAG